MRWMLAAAAGAAALLVGTATDAHAVLKVSAGGAERTIDANCKIQPNAAGDAFFQQVQDCLDELKALGKDGKIKDLIASGHTHTIVKTNGGSFITWGEDPDAEQSATGVPGSGADTTIRWNPTNSAFPAGYPDGAPRDPCAAFLHEAVHSHDADNGLLRLKKMNTTGGGAPKKVLIEEVRACQLQNWMHEAKGLASRPTYSGTDLPKGVQFDRCPDCIVLTFQGGFMVTLDKVVYEVPVTGVGVPNNAAMNVPGKRYEIRNGSNTLVGYVTVIKDLDGKVSFRLTAAAGQSVTLTHVQFKNNGANVGPNMALGTPLTVDAVGATNPTEATSEPVTPPNIGALRVNKCRDDQTVTQGGMITWKIKITNIGNVPLMNINVVDTFPACNYMIANLAVGATHEQECTVPANTAGSFTNQAAAQGMGPNNEVAQGQDIAKFTVKAP